MEENQTDLLADLREVRMGRRRLLEAIAAASGALAASAFLPDKWTKPVVAMQNLAPAPTTSPVLGTGDLQVTLTWDTDETDVDLFVQEPDGSWTCYYSEGTTSILDVDDTDGYGPENIYVAPGEAMAGIYKVYVGFYSGEGCTTATITITTFDNTPQQQMAAFTRQSCEWDSDETLYCVAEVTFPAGTIVETNCTISEPEAQRAHPK